MSTKKGQGKINKKDVLVKEREDQWRIEPCRGIPAYVAEKDPHCPSGQIRKFNEEKKLKAQILAQREKATATFIKTTLDHSLEDLTDSKYKIGNDVKSKVKTRESYAEIEILQKIVVRENLLVELHKLVKSQNDVSVCINEVVELVKALRFQTLDIVEDINAWQQTQPKVRAFEYKGFNYLVKIKCDLDFLDLYEEIVEKFCFEFNSNPLAYRGGGNVITGYTSDPRQKTYSQGLLQSYYSKSEDALLDGLDVTRLHNAEKIIQSEFQRIGREKSRGQELVQQQSQHAHQSNILDRDIFTALSKSTNSLHIDAASPSANLNHGHHAHTADGTTSSEAFGVNNNSDPNSGKKGKKTKRGSKTVINPKKLKLERIAQLQDEASDLKAMIVNVDEKIRFLTDHHHDLLNQRAALDNRLKEAKSMGRETAAQHIAAEISVNAAVVLDNSTKVKDLQRESYFINLERKRKLGTVQKLKDEMEKDKERAVMQKKIGSLIKKEGLLAALQSLNTGGAKISAKEVAEIGDKTLPRPKSAGVKTASPPKSAGKKSKRENQSDASPTSQALLSGDNGGKEKEKERQMSSSASAPVLPPLHARQQNNSAQNSVNFVNHHTYGTYIEEGEDEENGDNDGDEGGDDEEEGEEGEEDEEGNGDQVESEEGGEGGEGQYAENLNYDASYDPYQQQQQSYNQYQYQDSPQQYQQQQYAPVNTDHAHYAHGGEGYHQANAYQDHSHANGPGQEHGNTAYVQNAYAQDNDAYTQHALNSEYNNNYDPQLPDHHYYGQPLEGQSYSHSEALQEGQLYQQSTDYSHTDHTYTGYSQAGSHTDGDETLYGETLLDSAHSTIGSAQLVNQSESEDLQMHLSPVRHQHHLSHHHASSPHGNAYLSPSEGSYDSHTSKDSPLGYSMNSINSLGDVSEVHPHELQDDTVDPYSHQLDSSINDGLPTAESEQKNGLSSAKSRANVTAEEHMYISDDEDQADSRPHTSSTPSRNVYGSTEATNSAVNALNMSDLSQSPMALSMHSPALDESYSHYAGDSATESRTNRELFAEAVSLDGVVEGDYAAGGAYGLVKKLKLSPRPVI